MANKTEIYKDKRGEWRWRKKSSTGKIIGASTESYKDRKDCEANASRRASKDTWQFYKDKKGEYRWRRKASNGVIVGASSESFKARKDCQANAGMNGWKG